MYSHPKIVTDAGVMKASGAALLVAVVAIAAAGCASGPGSASTAVARGDILIDGQGVHPESVTSTPQGALFTGSINGIIYRAVPGETVARPFISPDSQNGLRSVFGVLADAKSGRLWVCSVANPFAPRGAGPAAPSELAAFELNSGKLVGRWPFPAPGGTCNDIAIAKDGSAYASDTPGGRILRLARGGSALEVVASDERLKGIDGLSFGADGALYINNVQRNELWRVNLPAADKPLQLTLLKASEKMGGPDGLRHIGNNRFLQAEGTSGRATLVTIKGDEAGIQVLRDGLNSSPGITLVGNTVYVVEGKIQYLFNPELRGKDPGPFKAIAIPLPR
jgi:sugar lactone lactonase YvrE